MKKKVHKKSEDELKTVAYWLKYIIWKNKDDAFWGLLKKLPVARFNRDLKKAIEKIEWDLFDDAV